MPRACKADDAAYQKQYLSDPIKKAQHKASADRYTTLSSGEIALVSSILLSLRELLIDWHHVQKKNSLMSKVL